MRLRNAMFLIALLLAGGCSTKDTPPPRAERLDSSLQTPELLSGSVPVLLTNSRSFSARFELIGQGKSTTGQLLGRQNHLIYAQDPSKNASRRDRRYEAITFFWDVSANGGYVLCDALQGYAPIENATRATSINVTSLGVSEKINGHRCRRVEKTVTLSDGSTAVYSVWLADDLGGFPMQIKFSDGRFLRFSKVKLEEIPEEMFQLPEGYTKFASPGAITSELIERQLRVKNKNAGEWNRMPVETPFQPPPVTNYRTY